MTKLITGILTVMFALGAIAQETKTAASKSTKSLTGQCHCGQIKFEAQGPVVKCSYCDCSGCRKASGSLKAPFVTVKQAGFKIIAGTPTNFRAACGEKCDANGAWNFCAKCGTPLFWKGDKGDEIDIFAGTLDDPTTFKVSE